MSIAGMVVWALTAGIGIYLLAVGITVSAARQEGSPLLEFVHPALALLGLTFWIFYVVSHYRTFAWIAFGVVVATVAAGLSWEAVRRRTLRRRTGSGRGGGSGFPPHLIMLHGAAAACTFALVVITAAASR